MALLRRTTREEHSGSGAIGTRPLAKRPLPFVGLACAPFGALLIAWVMHVYCRGFDLVWTVGKYRPIDWHREGNGWVFTGTILILLAAAGILAYVGWTMADSRKMPLRIMLTISTGMTTLVLLWAVITGPSATASYFQLIFWWIIAASWALARLDVTRRDPNAKPEEAKPDPLEEKLGLTGAKYTATPVMLDGDIVRTDIKVQLPRGGTIDTVTKALGSIESLADSSGLGGPAGMSSVRPLGGASKVMVTVIHKDILKPGVRYERPELKPDGTRYTIDETPLILGRYIDLDLAPESMRSTQGVMGTTGAGKGQYARVKIAAISTRSWVAPILYFDKVKGLQTAAPMVHALGTICLSDEPSPHKAGIKAIRRIVEYRANLLGELGYDEWEPGIIDHTGNPVPKLIAWFEECDELIRLAMSDMIFISGKARSTGVVPVWSMQRPDHKQMPTELRSNITNWSVFGIMPADEQSLDFALDGNIQEQGARPTWGDAMPGYYFRTERAIPAERWSLVRRVANADRNEIWEITSTYGPGMMSIDSGTIAASGGWLAQALEEAAPIKAKMTARGLHRAPEGDSGLTPLSPTASDSGEEPTLDITKGSTVAFTPGVARPFTDSRSDSEEDDEMQTDTAVDSDDAYTEDPEEHEQAMQQVDDEIEQMYADGTIQRNPELDEEDGGPEPDPDEPIVMDGSDESWEDDLGGELPGPKDREGALRALFNVLKVISEDPRFQVPGKPTISRFTVGDVYEGWPFRSRPWFSAIFVAVATGVEEIPAEYGLTLHNDEEDEADGHYTMHRTARSDA